MPGSVPFGTRSPRRRGSSLRTQCGPATGARFAHCLDPRLRGGHGIKSHAPFCWKAGVRIRRIARKLPPHVQPLARKNMRQSVTQTGRARGGFKLMPMKRRSFPLWLLRDVPALMGVMLSFWMLIIFAMTSARKAATASQASQSIRDRFALLLALAEAHLDYALWRQAYRRIGWHPRGVALEVFPPSTDWSYTQKRLRDFAYAFRNMNAIVDSYVDHIRERFGISQRELMTARNFPLRHAASQRATSPGFAGRGKAHCSLASLAARRGRWRALARVGGGSLNCRGPPLRRAMFANSPQPTSQAPPARSPPHARSTARAGTRPRSRAFIPPDQAEASHAVCLSDPVRRRRSARSRPYHRRSVQAGRLRHRSAARCRRRILGHEQGSRTPHAVVRNTSTA